MHLASVAFAALSSRVHGDDTDWDAWKEEYARNYSSEAEEQLRHEAFIKNVALARKLQEANPLATFGTDEFSDWTEEEKQALFGAVPQEDDAAADAVIDTSLLIPNQKDWEGVATTPVKKQQCGSCWANAAIEQIESDFILQKGHQFILSRQELINCNVNGGFKNGCNGGWPHEAYKSAIGLGGIELEKDYQAVGKSANACKYKQNKAVVTLNDWQYVGRGSESAMKQYVGSSGPLAVCVNAEWHHYKSGILTGCPDESTNHCVQLVGYGDSYWKVRNSWGNSWGENGHIRLAYGSNQCNINFSPTKTIAGTILGPSPSPSPSPTPSPTPTPSPSVCGTCKVCFRVSQNKCQMGDRAPKTKSDCEAKGDDHIWCGKDTFEEYV
jgi:hypothetical protein